MHFFTRLTQWEYYPWWLANIPVYGFWLWFGARARHLFFFSNVNPAIPMGGAMGESKWDILGLLPPEILPKGILVKEGEDFENVLSALQQAGISFPLIAKPDVGERGFLVKKIDNPEMLRDYLSRWKTKFILQEFLTLPVEASVLYHIFPGNGGSFAITSVCLKEFLSVVGDGASNLGQLMAKNARSAFQLSRFERDFPEVLKKIPAKGEKVFLEPIGNHSRGTKFLNGSHLITPDMLAVFEPICRRIQGVQYARFDLKSNSLEALQRGEFKVMELNGVLGEPAHIYDPRHGMFRAYRDFYQHWRLLFRINRTQQKLGHYPTPLAKGFRQVSGYFRYKKMLEK